MTTDLATRYGQTPGQNPTIAAKYGASAKAELPDLFAYLNSKGMSDGLIASIDSFSGEHNNEVWRTHGYYPGGGFQANKPNNSRANIGWTDGGYSLRMPLLLSHGDYAGQNSSFHSDAYGFTCGTQFSIDDQWIGIPGFPRACAVTSNYGSGVTGYYLPGMGLYNVAFKGSGGLGAFNPANPSALVIENGGSCAMVERVQIDDFAGDNIRVIGAIPLMFNHVRSFRSARASLSLEGCALATVDATRLEMDDSAIGINMIAGPNGQAAGLGSGLMNIKVENGKKTSRPMIAIKAAGQVNLTVGNMRASYYNGVRPPCVVDWSGNANSWIAVMGYTDSGTSLGGGPLSLVKTSGGSTAPSINSDGFGFSVKGSEVLSGQR